MRYFGGGLGHQNQEDRWTTGRRDEEPDNGVIDVDDSEDDQAQAETGEANTSFQLQELHQLVSGLTSGPAGESDEDVDSEDNDSDVDSIEDKDVGDEDDLFAHDDSDEADFGPEDRDGEGYSNDGFDGF